MYLGKSNDTNQSEADVPANAVKDHIFYDEVRDMNEDQDGESHQAGSLHPLPRVLVTLSRVNVVPGLDQVD